MASAEAALADALALRDGDLASAISTLSTNADSVNSAFTTVQSQVSQFEALTEGTTANQQTASDDINAAFSTAQTSNNRANSLAGEVENNVSVENAILRATTSRDSALLLQA